jgi:predicted DsbA family dithiol-disulfide isomerase
MDLESVNLLLEIYGVTEFPSIIVDENTVISGLATYEELESAVFSASATQQNQSFLPQ